jgi:hypothetical protein
MNDYNNGEVWGWNGGECPVHPKTEVRVWFRGKGSGTSLASGFRWNRADLGGDITAFQVVKSYVEPKTIWVNETRGGTGVMQDGKRIDPLSFFVQPVSDPACEHCGMDPAALTEQLEAARADAKKAEALAEELEAMNKNQEAMIRQADRRGDALETKLTECEARLGKAVEALREIAAEASVPVHTHNRGGINFKKMYEGWRKVAVQRINKARATLEEIEGEKG